MARRFRWVKDLSPMNAPGHDVVTGQRRDPLEAGWVLGVALDGGNSYEPAIMVATACDIARESGRMVSREALELAKERIDGLEELLAQANARIDELETNQERTAGLAAVGYTVVKKQGRPARKETS